MKTKQEFLDEVAKDFYLNVRSQPSCAPRQECAVAAYNEAEALWAERERRRTSEPGYQDELRKLQIENTQLRAVIADSSLPCVYCNLPAEDMAECANGFPGCGRADDMTL